MPTVVSISPVIVAFTPARNRRSDLLPWPARSPLPIALYPQLLPPYFTVVRKYTAKKQNCQPQHWLWLTICFTPFPGSISPAPQKASHRFRFSSSTLTSFASEPGTHSLSRRTACDIVQEHIENIPISLRVDKSAVVSDPLHRSVPAEDPILHGVDIILLLDLR